MLLFRKREEYTNDNVSLCLGHCDPLTFSWVSCLGNEGPPLTLEEIQQWCLVDVGWWGPGMNAMTQQRTEGGAGGEVVTIIIIIICHHHVYLHDWSTTTVPWSQLCSPSYLSSSTAPYLPLYNSCHQGCQSCHFALFCSCTSPPLSQFYPPTNSRASGIEIDSEIRKQDNLTKEW